MAALSDYIDHTARTQAALALQKIEQHERFCEERARKSEIFEAEVRTGIKDMTVSFEAGLASLHDRLNSMQQKIVLLLASAILSAMVGAIWWLLTK